MNKHSLILTLLIMTPSFSTKAGELGVGGDVGAGVAVLAGVSISLWATGTWPSTAKATGILKSLTLENLGITGITATDYTQMIANAMKTGDMTGIESYLAINTTLFEAVKPVTVQVTGAELGIANNQASYNTLVSQLDSGLSTPQSFKSAISTAGDILNVGQSAGFTPDQILSMAQPNSDYLPDGYSYTNLSDAVKLIGNTIANNSTLTGDATSANPAAFKAAATQQQSIDAPATEPSSGGSTGGPGTGAGSAGQPVVDTGAVNPFTVFRGRALTAPFVKAIVELNGITKTQFQNQLNALQSQIDELSENESENAAEIASLEQNLKAGQQVLDDPSTDFGPDVA